jgi:HEAT repeat protein
VPLLRRNPKPLDLREFPDAEWRIAASLGLERDPRAIAALLGTMHGYDEDRARQARAWIEAMPSHAAVDALMAALGQPHRYDQELVGDLLRDFAPECVPHLIRAMGGRATRREAMRVLADLKEPRAVAPMIQRAVNGSRGERQTAIWALGRHGSVEGFETALAALRSRSKELRRAAAWALGCIGDLRAVEPLVAILDDRDDDMRQSAVFALEKLRDDRAVDGLVRVMRDEAHDPTGGSYSAAKALSVCGQAGVSALIEAATDDDPKVRSVAYQGLHRDRGRQPIGDERVIRLLGAGVADDDEQAGHAAASALKLYTDRLAAEVLLPHLDDARPHDRSAAVWGVWHHDDDDVVDSSWR